MSGYTYNALQTVLPRKETGFRRSFRLDFPQRFSMPRKPSKHATQSSYADIPPDALNVREEALQLDYCADWKRSGTLNPARPPKVFLELATARRKPTCVEICAGAGGQAIGLDLAGVEHVALVGSEPVLKEIIA